MYANFGGASELLCTFVCSIRPIGACNLRWRGERVSLDGDCNRSQSPTLRSHSLAAKLANVARRASGAGRLSDRVATNRSIAAAQLAGRPAGSPRVAGDKLAAMITICCSGRLSRLSGERALTSLIQ